MLLLSPSSYLTNNLLQYLARFHNCNQINYLAWRINKSMIKILLL